MIDAAAWLRQTKAVYLDNATSVRDYRVQLRGNRSVMLFGVYLVTLIGVALIVYSNSAQVGEVEVVEAQRQLKNFYGVIMSLLAGLVCLIAPALTATTVVVERQRRSLDLVFSAPVAPKYFLVGKMISSFRYTWMLLVLALPVTAACVVLGGASWGDVLVAYLLLSLSGLTLTAIGLLMSTVAAKPVSAVIWSYAATIVFLIFTGMLAASSAFRSFMPGSNAEAPFFATLNPFLIQYTASTYTMIGATQVPNWIFNILIAGLLSKICLLAAGALLSPRPRKEIQSLRLHAIVYIAGLLLYISWTTASTIATSAMVSRSIGLVETGRALFWVLTPLFVFMPFLSTFGVDAERRFWPNGSFSIRHTLDGTPAGGLTFTLLFIGCCASSVAAGLWFGANELLPASFGTWLFFTAAFWTFFWAIGRYASSLFVGLRTARTIQFASFILLVVLPVPFLMAIADTSDRGRVGSVWDFYILRPLLLDSSVATASAGTWGALLAVLGIVIAVAAERRTARKMEVVRSRYDGDI